MDARTKAAAWMAGWCAAYTLFNACVKLLNDCPRETLIFIRLTLSLLFVLPWAAQKGLTWRITPAEVRLYLSRLAIGYAAMRATYRTYGTLPLATATAIGFVEPSFQALLAYTLFGVRIPLLQWVCILAGYGGALLMNLPLQAAQFWGVLLAFGANLLAAMAALLTRQLTARRPVHEVMLHGNLLTWLLSLTLLLLPRALGLQTTPLDLPARWPLLFLLGICAVVSQYCYMQAVTLTHVDFVAPLTYLRLLVSVPAGIFFFEEIPRAMMLPGALLILLANLGLYWTQTRKPA